MQGRTALGGSASTHGQPVSMIDHPSPEEFTVDKGTPHWHTWKKFNVFVKVSFQLRER